MLSRLGLYIHVPFCRRKCLYCDFYSVCRSAENEIPYAEALLAQMKRWKPKAKKYIADTVYIGGGTPSLLKNETMYEIMCAVHSDFRIPSTAEISIEANPGTLTGDKLAFYRGLGINRLSIGMQSANDEELRMLGRSHTFDEFRSAYYIARMEGFNNINADIMYGIPKQTKMGFIDSLGKLIELQPDHISLYGLKVEENTPLARLDALTSKIPSDETQAEMYLSAAAMLAKAGYEQYEISNFAKPQRLCRHNLRYWIGENYLGFGPSASSFFGNTRFTCGRDLKKYIACAGDESRMLSEKKVLTKQEVETEYVMLRFRLADGIDVRDYMNRFGVNFDARYGTKMEKYVAKEFILPTKTGYRLSVKGMLVSNAILSDILEFDD
ncbi:MAG: radical SAM family heme chaperone HemW [Clostridia bacterium]|nr:radical SAM family heme chaperone HemW [Clostridia bacterium]